MSEPTTELTLDQRRELAAKEIQVVLDKYSVLLQQHLVIVPNEPVANPANNDLGVPPPQV